MLYNKKYTSVYLPQFDPVQFLTAIQKYKIGMIFVPPPISILLAKHPIVDKFDLSSLRLIIGGSAPLSKDIQVMIEKRFKGNTLLFQVYGLTETPMATMNEKLEEPVLGSVGQLIRGAYAKIIDEEGNTLGSNETGEICLKSPLIMKGYYGDSKATGN